MIHSTTIINWAYDNNLNVIIHDQSNLEFEISKPWNIKESRQENISFITTGWINNNAGIVFANTSDNAYKGITIISKTPKLDFVRCVTKFFTAKPCNIITGKNFIVGENCSIGRDGFQYLHDNNMLIKFPHFGDIIIGDNVEIGNNTCIARGALSNTIIGNNVKIDNLVHIAHNVIIGDNTMIAASAMIAGSTNIGKNCWISPSSSIKNQLSIADNCLIGLGAVVINNVESNSVMVGNPAKLLRKQ